MDEKVFFNEGGVSVSNARFIAHGQTYAMSGITSVKSFAQTPSRKGPTVAGLIGAVLLLAAFASDAGSIGIFGAALIALAVFWWMNLKPEYSVLLSSSSGEAKAYSSKDYPFINKVITALNDAIVYRG